MVSVGADWTNREPLLGYPNALDSGGYVKPENGVLDLLINASKKENADKPYFIILDEMNLSHVERYFSDFISAMESQKSIPIHSNNEDSENGIPAELKLPPNLFIIGTVNIDETTYMFSPKVLDRANVIEFHVSENEMSDFLQSPLKPDLNTLKGAGASMAESFLQLARDEVSDFHEKDAINKSLLIFFNELKKAGAEFGYRTASEIYRFAGIIKKLTEKEGDTWSTDNIIDAAVMQKLLPKVHGSRKKLEPILDTLGKLCLSATDDEPDTLLKKFEMSPEEIEDSKKVRFKVSLEKILRMKKRANQDGFTSFAEA
tara:strand:- start:2623 stop:3570 length:948 start_codon:yes stop_codon:yes gene_type:complete